MITQTATRPLRIINLKQKTMKEQDLREKLFQSFYKELKEDDGFYDEETSKVCVQIAKDYAEQEAIEFAMSISTHCYCELGNDTRSYK